MKMPYWKASQLCAKTFFLDDLFFFRVSFS
jgi:hypothetical protein